MDYGDWLKRCVRVFTASRSEMNLRILLTLSDGPAGAGRVAGALDCYRDAAAAALDGLHAAGLVGRETEGTRYVYSISPAGRDVLAVMHGLRAAAPEGVAR